MSSFDDYYLIFDRDDECDHLVNRNPSPPTWTLNANELVEKVHCWHGNVWATNQEYHVHSGMGDRRVSRRSYRVNRRKDDINI